MDRRTFISALGGGLIAAPTSTRSQVSTGARVGWVGGWYSPSASASLLDAFREGMRDLGYFEGKNLTIDVRWMEGNAPEEAAKLTSELIRSKTDILVAQGQAVPGVKAGAGPVSIVFGFSGDPVAAGLVTSLTRPGANLTGFTLLAPELAGKRVELLKETAPHISRLAALTNPQHAGEDQELRETEIAATRRGLSLRAFPVRDVAEVAAALETIAQEHIDGVIALSNLLIMRERGAIGAFATKYRIATISGWEDFAVDGNLMSYGPNLKHAWRHVAARYVDKVLKGTKPADLSVQQPTEFQLVINQKTGKALGLTIPQSLLLRADRIVQ